MYKSATSRTDINEAEKPVTSKVDVDGMDNVNIGTADSNKKVEKPGIDSTDVDGTDNSGTRTKGATKSNR